jgi:hypothetical protein
MRFTAWSTLTNTFALSITALLSLVIPAANATVEIIFTDLAPGTTVYNEASVKIAWYVPPNGKP